MSEPEGSGIQYRLSQIERRVSRLEDLEPSVMKSQLGDVREDIQQLAREMGYIRKILTGFLVSFAIAVAVASFSLFQGG